MKKNMILAILMVALLAGLNACCCTVYPGKVVYSDKLEQRIDKMNIRAAILVDADGEIHLYDQNGTTENIRDCDLPEPDVKSSDTESMVKPKKAAMAQAHRESTQTERVEEQPQDDDNEVNTNVCRGMTKGSAVTSIRTMYIIKTNSDDCLGFGGNVAGVAKELCW